GPNASGPSGGVIIDGEGNLYGVTGFGGAFGAGAVYELKLKDGTYRERIIHSFDQLDGAEPNSLTFGTDGNLYGTAFFGGTSLTCPDCGVIFQLAKTTDGKWTDRTLLSLNGSDGFGAVGPPAFDGAGNLYAAAMSGGPSSGTSGAFGSVYKLAPRPDGTWIENTLHIFLDNFSRSIDRDGRSPYAGVIVIGDELFGTTGGGGVNNEGTVFTIKLHQNN